MELRKVRRVEPRMDFTPMVDVVFLLLLFILLSSTFIVEPGMRIDLPGAVTTTVESRKDLVIQVPWEEITNSYFLNGQRVSIDEYTEKLPVLMKELNNTTLIVAADERANYGRIVKVMDIAKSLGVQKITLATRKLTPPD